MPARMSESLTSIDFLSLLSLIFSTPALASPHQADRWHSGCLVVECDDRRVNPDEDSTKLLDPIPENECKSAR